MAVYKALQQRLNEITRAHPVDRYRLVENLDHYLQVNPLENNADAMHAIARLPYVQNQSASYAVIRRAARQRPELIDSLFISTVAVAVAQVDPYGVTQAKAIRSLTKLLKRQPKLVDAKLVRRVTGLLRQPQLLGQTNSIIKVLTVITDMAPEFVTVQLASTLTQAVITSNRYVEDLNSVEFPDNVRGLEAFLKKADFAAAAMQVTERNFSKIKPYEYGAVPVFLSLADNHPNLLTPALIERLARKAAETSAAAETTPDLWKNANSYLRAATYSIDAKRGVANAAIGGFLDIFSNNASRICADLDPRSQPEGTRFFQPRLSALAKNHPALRMTSRLVS